MTTFLVYCRTSLSFDLVRKDLEFEEANKEERVLLTTIGQHESPSSALLGKGSNVISSMPNQETVAATKFAKAMLLENQDLD